MTDPAEVIIRLMNRRGWTLATCESLTGGALGAAITSISGASTVYRGGLVTYASDLKASLAGMDPSWIDQHGVINERTAIQMADGARRACGASWGISTTGVAGPTMQDGEPVGTVWIGVARPGEDTAARRFQFDGDRARIRLATVDAALRIVLDCMGWE